MWGPMCAMLLTSYSWYSRHIAEIDQGTANCELFRFFFQKLFTDSNESFDSHFTLYGGPIRAMRSTS